MTVNIRYHVTLRRCEPDKLPVITPYLCGNCYFDLLDERDAVKYLEGIQ